MRTRLRCTRTRSTRTPPTNRRQWREKRFSSRRGGGWGWTAWVGLYARNDTIDDGVRMYRNRRRVNNVRLGANVRNGISRHCSTAVLLLLRFLLSPVVSWIGIVFSHSVAEASVPVRARRRSTGIINGDASGSQIVVFSVRVEPLTDTV